MEFREKNLMAHHDKLYLQKKNAERNGLRQGIQEKAEMGIWSPYSEEWEKQHLKKMIEKSETARLAFGKRFVKDLFIP